MLEQMTWPNESQIEQGLRHFGGEAFAALWRTHLKHIQRQDWDAVWQTHEDNPAYLTAFIKVIRGLDNA